MTTYRPKYLEWRTRVPPQPWQAAGALEHALKIEQFRATMRSWVKADIRASVTSARDLRSVAAEDLSAWKRLQPAADLNARKQRFDDFKAFLAKWKKAGP